MSFFDTANITADPSKAAKSYDPIPEGDYDLLVEKIEEKNSKNGDPMLSIKLKVENGEHTGRLLFETIMLNHANAAVVEMGQRKLHGLMLLTGVTAPKKADDFLGLSFNSKVTQVRDKGTGGNRNEVAFNVKASGQAAPPKSEADKSKPKGTAAAGGDW
jgi:hypothetical protein